MTVQHNFKVGDKVVINHEKKAFDHYEKYFQPYQTIVRLEGCYHIVLDSVYGGPHVWHIENLELYEEPKKEIEEWKPGWIVRNNQFKEEHEVLSVQERLYIMRCTNNLGTNWWLDKEHAHNGLLPNKEPAYSVVSREEKLKEESLPCVRTIPPQPKFRRIEGGNLFDGSQLFIGTEVGREHEVIIEFIGNHEWIYMDREELRKTAQAMNILADILEENEKENSNV